MIQIRRAPEPAGLSAHRAQRLQDMRALIVARGRDPISDEIDGYKALTHDTLWNMQHHKCCYCESKEQSRRNDVEHYRPKAEAKRLPGSTDTHGYWWLAWTWENLMFSCRNCNQSPYKLDIRANEMSSDIKESKKIKADGIGASMVGRQR